MHYKKASMQPYPREPSGFRVKSELLQKLNSPLSFEEIQDAIKKAFERSNKDKTGQNIKLHDSPNKLVQACLEHLRKRNDPILGVSFYSKLNALEIFMMDEIPHEMQRYRMKMGLFYQYLLIELMRKASNTLGTFLVGVFDGQRAGDVYADIRTPGYDKGLRLYISVKKSSDTVGGQDIGGAIDRLEDIAKKDKNLNSPYLCVIAIATPISGKITGYDRSRVMRYNFDHHPYSLNCETWLPGFLYPYITGHSAISIYKEAARLVDNYFPFYSLRFRNESSELLNQELIKRGISNSGGKIVEEAFFDYITQGPKSHL
jgi:hypothetical protein